MTDHILLVHFQYLLPCASLLGLFPPVVIRGKEVSPPADHHGLKNPVFHCIAPADEMGGLCVVFKGLRIPINLVQVNAIGIVLVLDHVEEKAIRFLPR